MERLHDRNHGKYVAIELTEGADVINAAKAGASAALQVRATLEQLMRPSARAELPGQTPVPPDPEIKSSSRSRVSVDLICTELTLRYDLGRLAPHGVPREQTRDARQTSRP